MWQQQQQQPNADANTDGHMPAPINILAGGEYSLRVVVPSHNYVYTLLSFDLKYDSVGISVMGT